LITCKEDGDGGEDNEGDEECHGSREDGCKQQWITWFRQHHNIGGLDLRSTGKNG